METTAPRKALSLLSSLVKCHTVRRCWSFSLKTGCTSRWMLRSFCQGTPNCMFLLFTCAQSEPRVAHLQMDREAETMNDFKRQLSVGNRPVHRASQGDQVIDIDRDPKTLTMEEIAHHRGEELHGQSWSQAEGHPNAVFEIPSHMNRMTLLSCRHKRKW